MNNNYHRYSAGCVEPVITTVIQSINNHFQRKKLCEKRTQYIGKDIAMRESQSLEQIRAIIPKRPQKASEDQRPSPAKNEPIRPFSAKFKLTKVPSSKTEAKILVEKRSQRNLKPPQTAGFLKPTEKRISGKIFTSARSIRSLKTHKQKNNQNSTGKFISLTNNEASLQEDLIQKLRVNKLEDHEYQIQKQRFLEGMAKQSQIYQQNQLKFINAMTKREYTYTFEGQILETKKQIQKNKQIKKISQLKTLQKKNEEQDEKNQTYFIPYKKKDEKDPQIGKVYEIEDEENILKVLRWKSPTAKYTIKK